MDSDRIMTPSHPRWREFIERLNRATVCRRNTDQARLVLAAMPGIEVEPSLRELRELGGLCDCAIVFELGAEHAEVS